MKNKYISKNMRNKLQSTVRFKSILFLFLGLLFSTTVKSQCQIIDTAIITNISCYGELDGEIELVLLDAMGLYSYAWNTVDLTGTIDDLPPNVYTVTITDLVDPACTQDTSFTITQPQSPLSTVANLYSDVDCFGDSSGIAFAENAIGGTFPYTYSWDTNPVQTTQLVSNLWGNSAGPGVPFTHTVTVTDSNGCTAQSSVDVRNSYPAITGIINYINQVSCYGACDSDVEFFGFGGQTPHTYTWTTPPTPISQVYYGSSGPDTAFNLCVGGNSVLIEDAVGCQESFPLTITEPDELKVEARGNGLFWF
jgi:hypothetical protein